MAVLDPIKPTILATRVIPNVDPGSRRQAEAAGRPAQPRADHLRHRRRPLRLARRGHQDGRRRGRLRAQLLRRVRPRLWPVVRGDHRHAGRARSRPRPAPGWRPASTTPGNQAWFYAANEAGDLAFFAAPDLPHRQLPQQGGRGPERHAPGLPDRPAARGDLRPRRRTQGRRGRDARWCGSRRRPRRTSPAATWSGSQSAVVAACAAFRDAVLCEIAAVHRGRCARARTQYDADLRSIQEARRLAVACRGAQRQFATASQAKVDRICRPWPTPCWREPARLGQMAHEETGYGVAVHKTIKIEFASRTVWESIKDIHTVGVLRRDEQRRVVEIGWPVGVIAAPDALDEPELHRHLQGSHLGQGPQRHASSPRIPPRQGATYEAVRLMATAGEAGGHAPRPGRVHAGGQPAPASQELMKHYATSLILATGGTPMVRAAHSVGQTGPRRGAGQRARVRRPQRRHRPGRPRIVNSKAFDCSTICATEQAVSPTRPSPPSCAPRWNGMGAYWVTTQQRRPSPARCSLPSGGMNPAASARPRNSLAALAGISVPASARVLVARPGTAWAGRSRSPPRS